MTEPVRLAYLAALDSMERTGPRPIHPLARVVAASGSLDDESLLDELLDSGPDNPLRQALILRLGGWDNSPTAPWVGDTDPNTIARRNLIIHLLELGESASKALEVEYPIARQSDRIVIAESWDEWYTDAIKKEHDFYWRSYRDFLVQKGWDAASIVSLDSDTDQVVERLSAPTRTEAYQAKGLVVGYVQSGKTANFTGVVAKAIDAGFRLVIVLTGTTDLLRAQTQRRLDMELVGVENILGDVDPTDDTALSGMDYQTDRDWIQGNFLSLGTSPSDVDQPAINRLTTYKGDYRSLQQGIAALDFPKRDRSLPFHSPINLYTGDAKLAVVKKNSTVLAKLVKDLKKFSSKLNEIPVLIIDDESDQASVNTSNPRRWAEETVERTAINQRISDLLKMLPRAQYVGYTATPFANVFVDPSDAENIFPKDFLISLPRPPGYMGASDFHDLDSELDEAERTVSNSRERAHVRLVCPGSGDDDQELLEALDAFVLAGAIKLFREEHGVGTFRHHTMLVHEGMRTSVHKVQADRIRTLWDSAGYYSPTSRSRLRSLFDRDHAVVSGATGDGEPFPSKFLDLAPHISRAVTQIGETSHPVVVVNSDRAENADAEELDFDQRPVWRIIVGGNKLARGFTVEGLTVSFFRRNSKQSDTLMQMGRWFGFRKSYRDLVRLYIPPELYHSFEGVVRDEEYFRNELRRYATPTDSGPLVTPRQIPPLVAQHLPKVKPTGAPKMYNVQLVERPSPGVGIEPVAYPKDRATLARNARAFQLLFDAASEQMRFSFSAKGGYDAYTGLVAHSQLLSVLQELRWFEAEHFEPDLRWLRRLGPDKVEDWVVIHPQLQDATDSQVTLLGHPSRTVFQRKRRRDPYFGAISDPKHRVAGDSIALGGNRLADPMVAKLMQAKRGSVLIYPLTEPGWKLQDDVDLGRIVLAFRLVAPADATTTSGRRLTFMTRDRSRPDAAIVDVRT